MSIDFTTVGFSVSLSGVLVYLLREWISSRIKESIKHEYDCKLELIRSESKLRSDKEIESVKHELKLQQTEIEIKTNWLQQRMATEIEEIYSLLWDFRLKVSSYVTDNQGLGYKDRDKVYEIIKSYREFRNKIKTKRIYLPRQTIEAIDKVCKDFLDTSIEYHKEVVLEKDPHIEIENWSRIDDYFDKEGSKIFEMLEENFRKLLGSHYYS